MLLRRIIVYYYSVFSQTSIVSYTIIHYGFSHSVFSYSTIMSYSILPIMYSRTREDPPIPSADCMLHSRRTARPCFLILIIKHKNLISRTICVYIYIHVCFLKPQSIIVESYLRNTIVHASEPLRSHNEFGPAT